MNQGVKFYRHRVSEPSGEVRGCLLQVPRAVSVSFHVDRVSECQITVHK